MLGSLATAALKAGEMRAPADHLGGEGCSLRRGVFDLSRGAFGPQVGGSPIGVIDCGNPRVRPDGIGGSNVAGFGRAAAGGACTGKMNTSQGIAGNSLGHGCTSLVRVRPSSVLPTLAGAALFERAGGEDRPEPRFCYPSLRPRGRLEPEIIRWASILCLLALSMTFLYMIAMTRVNTFLHRK